MMRRYGRHFVGSAPTLIAAAVLVGISGVIPAASVMALHNALDALPASSVWLGVLVGLAVLQAGALVLRNVLTRRLAAGLVHTLRMRVHQRFHQLRDAGSVGARLAALSKEADALQYGVSAGVTALRNPLTVLTLIAVAVHLAPGLALRTAGVLPVIGLVAWAGGHWVRRATTRWTQAHRELLSELADQHGGLQTTMDLSALDLQMTRAGRLSEQEASLRARRDWVRSVPTALVQLGIVLALVALVGWGAGALERGETTPGALVGFAAALGLLQRPLVGLTEVWTLFQRSTAALERIEDLLEAPLPPQATDGETLAVRDVTVSGRLGPVTLDVQTGRKVAVVGRSGAGKSTLLAVLAGQLAPDGGEVERVPSLLLRQDPWVFDRSVRDNLLLGDPDAEPETLRAMLEQVGLDVALERGLDAAMGGRGAEFSGGEAQRLCLARALLAVAATPVALLVDEATSEVDPESRGHLAAVLAALPTTVVFASHEPSFARLADHVVWMERGVVRAVGPHDELLAVHPGYRAHWDGLGAAA